MKRFIALLIMTGIFTGLYGCGTEQKPDISLIETNGTEYQMPEQMEEEAAKTSVISKDVLDLLKDKEDVLKEIQKAGAEIEEKEGEVWIFIEDSVQREAALSYLSDCIKNSIDSLREKGCRTDCLIELGSLTVYGKKDDAKAIEETANQIFPYVAIGQKLYDNTRSLSMTVFVNDSETGNSITRTAVTADAPYALDEQAWEGGQNEEN